MTTDQRDRIEQHGRQLLAIFPGAEFQDDPVHLCKRLRQLETKANRLAVAFCSGDFDTDRWETESERVLCSVQRLLNPPDDIPIFVNSDPRGYALKIRDDYVRKHDLDIHRDWGGYGILAPEIT